MLGISHQTPNVIDLGDAPPSQPKRLSSAVRDNDETRGGETINQQPSISDTNYTSYASIHSWNKKNQNKYSRRFQGVKISLNTKEDEKDSNNNAPANSSSSQSSNDDNNNREEKVSEADPREYAARVLSEISHHNNKQKDTLSDDSLSPSSSSSSHDNNDTDNMDRDESIHSLVRATRRSVMERRRKEYRRHFFHHGMLLVVSVPAIALLMYFIYLVASRSNQQRSSNAATNSSSRSIVLATNTTMQYLLMILVLCTFVPILLGNIAFLISNYIHQVRCRQRGFNDDTTTVDDVETVIIVDNQEEKEEGVFRNLVGTLRSSSLLSSLSISSSISSFTATKRSRQQNNNYITNIVRPKYNYTDNESENNNMVDVMMMSPTRTTENHESYTFT